MLLESLPSMVQLTFPKAPKWVEARESILRVNDKRENKPSGE